MKRIVIVFTLIVAPALLAQRKLTIDTIYDPANSNVFASTPQKGFVWVDDDHFLWPRRNAAGDVVADVLVDARTGREVAILDSDDLQAQARRIEGVSDEDAKQLSRQASPEIHSKSGALLVTLAGDPNPIARLFIVDAASGAQKEINLEDYRTADPLIVAGRRTAGSSSRRFRIASRRGSTS